VSSESRERQRAGWEASETVVESGDSPDGQRAVAILGADDCPGAIDAGNAQFWDELCGSALARQLGIDDASQESLSRFDAAYLALYPYLPGYLDGVALAGAARTRICAVTTTATPPARLPPTPTM
jgi:hypothetical protein